MWIKTWSSGEGSSGWQNYSISTVSGGDKNSDENSYEDYTDISTNLHMEGDDLIFDIPIEDYYLNLDSHSVQMTDYSKSIEVMGSHAVLALDPIFSLYVYDSCVAMSGDFGNSYIIWEGNTVDFGDTTYTLTEMANSESLPSSLTINPYEKTSTYTEGGSSFTINTNNNFVFFHDSETETEVKIESDIIKFNSLTDDSQLILEAGIISGSGFDEMDDYEFEINSNGYFHIEESGEALEINAESITIDDNTVTITNPDQNDIAMLGVNDEITEPSLQGMAS